jgi:RimJ/RimL family protein N-acetyltransferase
LRLDPWSEAHTALLVRLSSMPPVVRYIGRGALWSRREAEEVAAAQSDHWRRHGFGWRAAVEKETGQEVGFAALNFVGEGTVDLDPSEHEIGWWLDAAVWGRGFAREGALAIRDEAFTEVAAPSVVARIQPENVASVRVAEATGLRFDSETRGRMGEPLLVYRLSAADWRRTASDHKPS